MGIAYYEAAVATCDAELAASGGRGVFDPAVEAQARGGLGAVLHIHGEEQQRSLELLRQSVSLLRQAARTPPPGYSARDAKLALAIQLGNLGAMHIPHGLGAVLSFRLPNMGIMELQTFGRVHGGVVSSEGLAEAKACLREALELSEATDVDLKRATMANLAILSNQRPWSQPF